MSTNVATSPTLLDLARQMDPNGSPAAVVEILTQTSDILQDMSWMEGNLTTGHRTTIRTGIPTPTWVKLNEGVAPTKGTTAQATFNTGRMEAFGEVDERLAKLYKNVNAFRLSEDRAHIEGMNQEMASKLFFGNQGSAPEQITGLAAYYNDTTADNSENIILGGGAGTDNASIWLVVWSNDTITGIVPQNSVTGVQVEDLGRKVLETDIAGTAGKRMIALMSHYSWDCGLMVKDWRYAVRIPNIDKSALTKDASSGADLPDLMYQAMEQIPNLAMGRPVFYMSRATRSFVRRQCTNLTKNSSLQITDVGGRMLETFHGIPLRRVDALAADETLVS